MNLAATFRHMPEPPHKPGERKRSKFRTTPGVVYHLLASEIRRLGGREIIIEAGFHQSQIRNDGWPYSNARPLHPAVRVSFQSNEGPLSFDCQTYSTIDDNLHAIAKTMERLRDIARYGAVKGGQQYRGWKQLPGDQPPTQTATAVDLRMAAAFLCMLAGEPDSMIPAVLNLPSSIREVYRAAALKCHPDRGGSPEMMARVNAAKDLIEKHQTAGVA